MSFRHAQSVSEKGSIVSVCHDAMSFETIAICSGSVSPLYKRPRPIGRAYLTNVTPSLVTSGLHRRGARIDRIFPVGSSPTGGALTSCLPSICDVGRRVGV